MSIKHLDKVVSLCKRKGFVFPNSEIYGGLKASYDYGPLGVELKKSISESFFWTILKKRLSNVDFSPFFRKLQNTFSSKLRILIRIL